MITAVPGRYAAKASIAVQTLAPLAQSDDPAEGAILGTLQYMAPEQLEGKEADSRTDIFAFGATLYESITGKKAFEGKSQASLIGSILKDTPKPISALQPVAPATVDRFIMRCLAKDPDNRSIGASAPARTERRKRDKVISVWAAITTLLLVKRRAAEQQTKRPCRNRRMVCVKGLVR